MNIERYAQNLGINLYEEYTTKDGARLARVGVNTLAGAAKSNDIDFIQTGKRNKKYLGVHLVKWKLSKITKSENTTSQQIEQVSGAELGTTQRLSKERLQAFARETFSARKTA